MSASWMKLIMPASVAAPAQCDVHSQTDVVQQPPESGRCHAHQQGMQAVPSCTAYHHRGVTSVALQPPALLLLLLLLLLSSIMQAGKVASPTTVPPII
jgi:hypothetical protein